MIKPKLELKVEKSVKIDNGNSISRDAIKKEEEELEKRPEIEILEKLKRHENEEKKILAESKQILEELKGARQIQAEKSKKKSFKPLKELNTNIKNKQEDKKIIISSDEKKNQIEGVVKDKMPFPLALKEANKFNNSKNEVNREKRDLPLSLHSNDIEKDNNCEKNENNTNNPMTNVKDELIDKNIENVNITS